jgi:hypothetical protein
MTHDAGFGLSHRGLRVIVHVRTKLPAVDVTLFRDLVRMQTLQYSNQLSFPSIQEENRTFGPASLKISVALASMHTRSEAARWA